MLRAMTRLVICKFNKRSSRTFLSRPAAQTLWCNLMFSLRYTRLYTLKSRLLLGVGWGQVTGILADGQRDVHQHECSHCYDACYRPWHPAA